MAQKMFSLLPCAKAKAKANLKLGKTKEGGQQRKANK